MSPPIEHCNLYTDESRQSADRYMVLGGLALSGVETRLLAREMASFRHATQNYGEFKWTKVSKGKYQIYEMLVDMVFRHIHANGIGFHCMIVDRHILDYRNFHEGDRDKALSVLYYNLLLHAFARRYAKVYRLRAYLDYSGSKTGPDELRDILNSGWGKLQNTLARPFEKLERVNSKRSDLIQLADVLIGAIGWHRNEKIGAIHKAALAARIANHLGVTDCSKQTRISARFSVWHWTPKKAPRR